MRIESLPLERYLFCARLQMSKQKKEKETGRELTRGGYSLIWAI